MENALNLDSSECSSFCYSENAEEVERHALSPPKSKRARKEFLTPRLSAVLDKLKISERDAVHLLVALIEAVGLNNSDFVINRTSIRKQRDTFREAQSKKITQTFSDNTQPVTIHWDTKLLTSLTGKTEDRLAVIATAPSLEHILNMPEIPSGTGLEISSAVYDALEENNILEKTQAFVFDTTSANTGRLKGACTLLEKRLGREILFLGCRHHILEIVLAAVFNKANVELPSGPDITIFKKFKKLWPNIQQTNYSIGLMHPRIKYILGNDTAKILNFAYSKITENFPRNDYKEFLELIIIFLGGTPPRGIKFFKPGAMHFARWMSKAIYSLKILLFRNQLPELTKTEENSLIEVAGFIIKCNVFFWFHVDKAEEAPLNDLEFIRALENYKKLNKEIADVAISKIINHLYYLNEECVGFALFDDRIDGDTKAQLIEIMCLDDNDDEIQEDEEVEMQKKLTLKAINIKSFIDRNNAIILKELFSKKTKLVFKRFNISTDFLKADPNTWQHLEGYKNAQNYIKKLKVTNDCAERGIKLITDYHDKITKDEEQKQHLLKVVQNYRQQYSKNASLENLRTKFKE